MIRLFVAIELPEAVKAELARLCGGVPGAKWVKPENLHLTMRFIGEVNEDAANDIAAVLDQIRAPSFNLVLSGVGQFSSHRTPRVLWVGVEKNESLVYLTGKVESALVRAGVSPDRRRFSPHITLARLRTASKPRINSFVSTNAMFTAGPIDVDSFILFSSFLGRNGALHRPEAVYPLDAAI
ncbi:MAG: RNA 2',3'-cyclic phosphodiesterase [Alphaproteobacteria bacterium]